MRTYHYNASYLGSVITADTLEGAKKLLSRTRDILFGEYSDDELRRYPSCLFNGLFQRSKSKRNRSVKAKKNSGNSTVTPFEDSKESEDKGTRAPR